MVRRLQGNVGKYAAGGKHNGLSEMWRGGGFIYSGGKRLASHFFQGENFPRAESADEKEKQHNPFQIHYSRIY
jgi:hypothetical protein